MTRRALFAVLALSAMTAAATLYAADAKEQVLDLKTFVFKFPAGAEGNFGFDEGEGRLFFYSGGSAEAPVKVAEDGEYTLVIRAMGTAALDMQAEYQLSIDGMAEGKPVMLKGDEQADYPHKIKLKAGEHKIAIAFTNDAYKEGEYDRNLYVYAVTLKK